LDCIWVIYIIWHIFILILNQILDCIWVIYIIWHIFILILNQILLWNVFEMLNKFNKIWLKRLSPYILKDKRLDQFKISK